MGDGPSQLPAEFSQTVRRGYVHAHTHTGSRKWSVGPCGVKIVYIFVYAFTYFPGVDDSHNGEDESSLCVIPTRRDWKSFKVQTLIKQPHGGFDIKSQGHKILRSSLG